MRRGFIKQIASAKELQMQIAKLAAADVDVDAIVVATQFDEIYPSINQADVVVVINYASVSESMNNFFDTIEEVVDRGASIESLDEPDVPINAKTAAVFRVIYNLSYELRKTRTLQGLDKARSEGKTLGRPVGTKKVHAKAIQVDELRQTTNISVAEACRIAGCLPRTYYRLKKTK